MGDDQEQQLLPQGSVGASSTSPCCTGILAAATHGHVRQLWGAGALCRPLSILLELPLGFSRAGHAFLTLNPVTGVLVSQALRGCELAQLSPSPDTSQPNSDLYLPSEVGHGLEHLTAQPDLARWLLPTLPEIQGCKTDLLFANISSLDENKSMEH